MDIEKIDFIDDFFIYENIPKIHHMVVNYFGKETINKLFLHHLKNIYEHYPSMEQYRMIYPSFTNFVDKSHYKKIPMIQSFFWDFLLIDMGYGMKSDAFEIPATVQKVIDAYWTEEFEIEYKKYLAKYGFFSYREFCIKLQDILGREIYKQFIHRLEMKKHADTISIYLGSLRFSLGLKPEIVIKKCKYCGEEFIPSFDLVRLINDIERLYYTIESINDIEFCRDHILPYYYKYSNESYQNRASKENMIDLLKELIAIGGFIPPSNFKSDFSYLKNFDKEKFDRMIIILNKMPDFQDYKRVFGSWFKTLIAANVLEEGIRKMSRGYMCLAEDGHECLSLGEKNIDDWLYRHNIGHQKEPKYPGEYNFRGDWKVGNYFIEYWGLAGQEDYDNKILLKREIAKEFNLSLIEIHPNNLNNLNEILKNLLKNHTNV